MLHHCIICFAVFIAASHIILYIISSSTPYTFTSVIASHFPNITPSSMADTSRLPRDTTRRLPPNPCTRAADVSGARPFMPAFTILIPRHDALAITQSSAFPYAQERGRLVPRDEKEKWTLPFPPTYSRLRPYALTISRDVHVGDDSWMMTTTSSF